MGLLMIVAALCPLAAGADTGISPNVPPSAESEENLLERLRVIPDFKFKNHPDGIGYGDCPVYTAPSNSAFRCANGRATCSTDTMMSEAGYDAGWLMVRYQTSNGSYRTGYIPPTYIQGFHSIMSLRFDYIPVVAADTICVTDNPMVGSSAYAGLDAGEPFYILGKYTYNGSWWYIECTVDGRLARGFIQRDASRFTIGGRLITSQADVGSPALSPLGSGQIGEVMVSGGERKNVRESANAGSRQITVAYGGRRYPCYGVQQDPRGRDWYYIWVESDSLWGWVSSGVATLISQ